MSEKQVTTIKIYAEDKNKLAAYGIFGESFADVVHRILAEKEENSVRESQKVNPCEAALALALA
ncbi:MAG: hypothetical protein WBN94_04230 [Methanothrix sp.]